MARQDSNFPINEPLIVPDLFVTGAIVERTAQIIRFVGYVRIPQSSCDSEERRVVLRFAMPTDDARELSQAIELALEEKVGWTN